MTPNGIAESLNSFIKAAMKKPLWVFGWMVFVASASYTVNFFIDYPNQQAHMDSNTVRFNTYTQDNDEALQAVQISMDSNKSFLAVIEQYNLIGKKIANNENVSYDEVNQALSDAKETRIFLKKSIGTLDGISFNDASLDKYVQDFSKYVSDKEKITTTVIAFYEGALSQDKQKVDDSIVIMQEHSVNIYQQASEEMEQFQNFTDEFNNFSNKNMIEITNETNKLVIYSWKSKLVVAAMAYSIIFPLFGAYFWLKKPKTRKAPKSNGKAGNRK